MNYINNYQPSYIISSVINPNYVFDCHPQNKVCLYPRHNGLNQRWYIINQQNGYSFQNVQNMNYLTIPNNNNGTQLQYHQKSYGYNSTFTLVDANQSQSGRMGYFIRTSFGKAIDIPNNVLKDSQKLVQWDYNSTSKNQIFYIQPASFLPLQNQQYKIMSALDQNIVLDISQNQSDYHRLIVYSYQNSPNQKFYIVSRFGKYLIVQSKSGLVLQVAYGQSNNGASIIVYQESKSNHQLWDFVPIVQGQFKGRNAFVIRSHCGKVLDIHGGKAQNQRHVQLWDYNGGRNQVWLIIPV